MLAARKVPAALKWIEDRRENLMSAGQSRHVDGTVRMAFDADGNDPRRRHRLRPGRRRLPDAVPGADHRRDRHVLPRPVPGAQGQLQLQDGVLQHRGPGTPTAVRGSTKPSRAKCFSTSPRARWAWTPSSCAASTSCAATRCRTSTPTACRTTTSRPLDTFEQAVKILDHEGFRKEQADALAAGPLHRARLLGLHRADRRGDRAPRPPRARRSAWSRPARSTSTSTAARAATASRPPSCSSPPTRWAPTSTTSPRSRATPR